MKKSGLCVHIQQVFLLFTILFCSMDAYSQSQLIRNLDKGKSQRIVVYGTSLSARPDGWPAMLSDSLNAEYPGKVEVINSAKGAMWSTWGVENLQKRVLDKQPDAVLIEFGMNDAYLPYRTSLKASRLNLEYMIDRIKEMYPTCEIILQVMNMPIREHKEQRPLVDDYYDMYRKVARKRKLLLIDHYEYWLPILEKGEQEFLKWAPDGIHPEEPAWQTYTVPYILKSLKKGR